MASDSSLSFLLKHAVGTINKCLPSDRELEVNHNAGHGKLMEVSVGLSAVQNTIPSMQLTREEKRAVWHMTSRLWKWCDNVEKSATDTSPLMASIRKHTSDVMELMNDDELFWDERSAKVTMYHKIGSDHAKVGAHEAAEAAYSKAQEQGMRLVKELQGTNVLGAEHSGILAGCTGLLLDRLSNAWKLKQPALASECLSQATEVFKQAALPFQQAFHMRRQDVLNSVKRRKRRQSAKDIDAQGLLDHTHQLVSEHLELGKNGTGLETSQKEATSLQAQVLRLLSQAYLLSGQAELALTCVQNVRKLQDPPDDAPGLCLTAIEALILLDRLQQVDAELLALVLHRDASAALCLAALSAVIQAPRCTALKPAADIVLQRFAEDATVPLRLVEALLGASEAQRISEEREALILDIARNGKVLQQVRKASPLPYKVVASTRDQLFTLLWHHANQRLANKDFQACEDFCTAALGYAEEDAKADVMRQLVQTKLAQKDHERAQRSLDTFADTYADSFTDNLPESHVLRMKEEARRVLNHVRSLLNSNNPFEGRLVALMSEAERVSHPFVAFLIWKALWKDAIATQGPSKRRGVDALIALGLMKKIMGLLPEKKNTDLHAASADNLDGNSILACKELEQLFTQAEDRLGAVGRDNFFGTGPEVATKCAQLAWDIGMGAKKMAKNPTAGAAILHACGSFSEAIPCTTLEQWTLMRDAYIMSAQCRLEEFEQHPERKPYCLSQLQILHSKTSAALEAAMQLPIDPDDVRKARRCLFTMEFNLAEEQNEPNRMVPALERAKAQGLFAAEDYLQFSMMCLDNPPNPHTASAAAAVRAALHVMRSQKKWPKMKELAQTVEELYNLSSDGEKVALLADIGAFVRSVKRPSYPSDELSWLINTTWTFGRKHAQEQRNNQALPLMAAAVNLMDLSDEFSDSKEMFEVELEKVQKEALARPDRPHDASSNIQATNSKTRSRRPRRGLRAAISLVSGP